MSGAIETEAVRRRAALAGRGAGLHLLVVELLLLVTSAARPGAAGAARPRRQQPPARRGLRAAARAGRSPAALYALHHRSADLTDLRPAAAFWRGYRPNLGSAADLGAVVVWLTIVAVNLANFAAAGVPGWWAVLLRRRRAAVSRCGRPTRW